ncbi:hypothetical protein ACIPMW_32395 [Streptomyces sp. NPDC086669]|uniref:hypothetical protein n=1 Tax=Streptomyces sp. NPDC086669 TaxID=3365753 RepID=UPI0037F3E41A
MRRTTTVLLAACLLVGAAVGCSSGDDEAKDCAAALSKRTGGDPGDTPTIAEAKDRVDAVDDTLAGMVRAGYETVAEASFNKLESKTKAATKDRPTECEGLSDDDYTTLVTAKAIDGLGWTDENGEFDKTKMLD